MRAYAHPKTRCDEPKAKKGASPIHAGGRVRCDNSIPQHTALAKLQRKSPGTETGACARSFGASAATRTGRGPRSAETIDQASAPQRFSLSLPTAKGLRSGQQDRRFHSFAVAWMRVARSCLMQPAERPHKQEYGNGNTQQPQQSCTRHFGLLCLRLRFNG
jgi:hypothetical protein